MVKNFRPLLPRLLAAAFAAALLFSAAATRAADLTLAFRAVHGPAAAPAPVALDAPETLLPLGPNRLSITRVSALISSVAFVRPDGSFAQLEGQFGALDLAAGRDRFTLRGVPAGRYQGLQFLVGLRPATNHGDPAQWPAGHPLNPLVNGLHWDWQGGYIFLALEGRYLPADTAPASAPPALGGWSFHLATDPRLTLVELPFPLEISADSTLALDLDLARVLAGITIAPDADSTHSRPGDRIADRLVQNLPASFRVSAFTLTPPAPATAPRSDLLATRYSLPATSLPFVLPPGFPQVELPADNPLTVEGVALGAKLFRDPRLSGDGTQACIDCHRPAHAFSDPRPLSLGIKGQPGTRHSMPLLNLAWSPNYAWDGSQPRIRDQALAAMRNPLEMHADPEKVAALLAADPEMSAAFESAFGPADPSPTSTSSPASALRHSSLVIGHSSAAPASPVTAPRIAAALEQHLLTLVSADSRFDRALRGEAELTEQEKEGFALFATEFDPGRGQRGADCFHCHGGQLFTDHQPKNNGLDLVSKDPGRAAVTSAAADRGKFKTPSLRNVALTAPYMHDGRFRTLEDVIAHYDHGVARTGNLDPNLAKHPPEGLSLTAADQAALLAFLRTLTDERLGAAKPD